MKPDAAIPTLLIWFGIVKKATPTKSLIKLASVGTAPDVLIVFYYGEICLLLNLESVYGCQLSLISG